MDCGRAEQLKGWSERLMWIGATEYEVELFLDLDPDIELYAVMFLALCRIDRKGVSAARKEKRRKNRNDRSTPERRLQNSTRARIWNSLKGRSDGRLFSRLGYTLQDLVAHLESKFTDGMTWDNYGEWHVDHIKPCAAFDLTLDGQFEECWSLENLQPLWASDNVKKGAKYG